MSKQDRVVADNIERVEPVVPMFRSEMIMVALTGLGVGFVVTALTHLLDRYIFSAVLCQDAGAAECANATNYALIVAMVIAGIGGLIALVQARIYRPLLVVLAAAASLWGLHGITANMQWYWSLLLTMVMFALAYALFTWMARIRMFLVSLIVIVVLVVLARLTYTL